MNTAKFKDQIDPAVIKILFDLDHSTGKVTRKVGRGGQPSGSSVGCRRPDGYLVVAVCKRLLFVHRIVWVLHTGDWPQGVIDHINGVKSDNRVCNLRDIDQHRNLLNQKKDRTRRSGFKGVDALPSGLFRARLSHRHLGVFKTAKEASDACESARSVALGEVS